jgi:hypothetical protein
LIMSIKNAVKGRDSRLNELYSARSKGLTKRKRDSRIPLETANIPFRVQGRFHRRMFIGFQERRGISDKIVLGMPWLTNENPQIDWKEITIKVGMIASKDLGEFGTLRRSKIYE